MNADGLVDRNPPKEEEEDEEKVAPIGFLC
jgi:hypothetical protein